MMLEALSPQRRRLVYVLGVLALAVIVLIAVVVIVRNRTPTPVPQDELGPVLLVPGYGGSGDSLQNLAGQVRAAGRTAIVVPEVGSGTGDLQAQADALATLVDQTLAEGRAPSVDVIGYSAGGVVARLWARNNGGAAQARRILTLGSPQHGTSQAALGAEIGGGCPTACQQLVPASDLLRRLNAGDETPAGPDWVTIRSTSDQVVTPVSSAALDGAVNIVIQDVCPGSTDGHPELPDSPVTRAAITSALGVSPPAPPTDVRC